MLDLQLQCTSWANPEDAEDAEDVQLLEGRAEVR